jgi:hypothetical protein
MNTWASKAPRGQFNMPLGESWRPLQEDHDSVRGEALYNILIEFGVPMKLKMKSTLEVRIGKHLSDNFHIQDGIKQGDALPQLLFNAVLL